MGDFDGMVALVTGGASGIGAATAGLLAERGARVAVLDLDPDAADARHLRLACDVGDRASVDAAVGRVAADLGGLDVVVNNAGIGAQGDVAANDDDEWRRVLDVNVVGIVRVSRAALPHLRRSPRAAVVNTCSVVATLGLPNRALYAASKGAVLALTLAMAADHVREGIRVNCVTPGTVETPWVGRLLEAAGDPAAELAALRARQPLGRLVGPAEVAAAIAYLASPQAGATTGTALAVDGGMAGLRLPVLVADGVAGLGVEEVDALGVDHDLDLVAGPDPGAGAKAATNLVPAVSAWAGASSVWASLSSSLVSAVTTLGASSSKWTTIWAPRASTRPTVALRRVSAGASRTSRASSMSSLRIPTATSRAT